MSGTEIAASVELEQQVPLHQEVFRAVRYTLVGGKAKSSLVVFKRSGLDGSTEVIVNFKTFHNVNKKTLKRKERRLEERLMGLQL